MPARKLTRSFYARDTLQVAADLIGMHLVHRTGRRQRVVRIVETEAYQGPEDLAAHSSRGLTPRTQVMFGAPGHAYVYFIYGVWHCLNIVTRERGVPHAVLLRAAEPVQGIDDKTWGPGLLCRAMGIDRALNGADLCGPQLWIERPPDWNARPPPVQATRIGVDYAGDWARMPWRYLEASSPYVSTASASARRGRS